MLEIIKKMPKNMASCEENRDDKTDIKEVCERKRIEMRNKNVRKSQVQKQN